MPAKKSSPFGANRGTLFVLSTFLIVLIGSILFINGEPPFNNLFQLPQRNQQRLNRPDDLMVDYQRDYQADPINLPLPRLSSNTSVEQALAARRTVRSFQADKPLSLATISQMLWAAQGVTVDWGGRTAPSAKNAYPLEVYLVAKNVSDLEPGIYQYIPGTDSFVHQLGLLKAGDFTDQLNTAAVQDRTQTAPAAIVISGNFQRMTDAFDGRPSDNNVYLEAGHAAQNLYLQSESLGLGMVVMGGYDKALMADLIMLPRSETPIYLIPFGYPSN